MKYLPIATFILLLSACGSDDKSAEKDSDNLLNLQPLFEPPFEPEWIYSSQLGKITTFNKVTLLADNKLLILGETSLTAENGKLEGFAAITNLQGETYSFTQSDTGYVDACAHPSGEYSLGVFLPSDDDKHQVEIQRYSTTGKLLYTAPMVATTLESEYVIPFNNDDWLASPYQIVENPNQNIGQLYSQKSISW